MAFIHLLNVYGKSEVKLPFLSEHCYLHFHLRAWEFWQLLPHPNRRKVGLGINLCLSRVHEVTNTIAPIPPRSLTPTTPRAFILVFRILSRFNFSGLPLVTFKATRRGDRGLKAINNQMLSEPHWRKRMQLYEQDPGLRRTTVCFRSLWGLARKWESGGVAYRPHCPFIFLCCFIPAARNQQHERTQRL